MKIKKNKSSYIAYATEDNENGTKVKAGDEMGRMSIKTGKFWGMTACLYEIKMFALSQKDVEKNIRLNAQVKKHNNQALVDEVLEEIKKDVLSGDLTAIDEMLFFLPTSVLKGYLANEGD
jgi:hypothetical protein